jgi:prolipoprotein diacylglyceryltransferase
VLRRHPKPGTAMLLFLALYSGQRVFLEAFRADSLLLPGGWRAAQVVGLLVLAVSLVTLARRSAVSGEIGSSQLVGETPVPAFTPKQVGEPTVSSDVSERDK